LRFDASRFRQLLRRILRRAATTQADRKAFFSNFGWRIDVGAPGGGDQTPVSNIVYRGDANFDGRVSMVDYRWLASNYQHPAPWTGGDFDGDGQVNFNDLVILAQHMDFTNPTFARIHWDWRNPPA
jgi:hypothetical protein